MCKRLVATLLLVAFVCASSGRRAQAGAPAGNPPQFAFWYEDWRSDTWAKLQPANVIIGVPASAVAEIHAHGGRALRYVTFYQAGFGTTFLRDRADLENVGFHTPAGFLPSAFGGKDNFVLCSNSAELWRRVLGYVDRTMGEDGYDGLFIDNAYLPPARDEVCDGKHAHKKPGENGGAAYVDLLAEVYAAVKTDRPGAIVMTNAGNPREADKLTSGGKSLWDVSDFVLWESYGYSSHVGKDHDRWGATLAESKTIASSPHAEKVVALSYPRNRAEALFSYAVARVFGFAYAANLGEADFGREHEGGHFGVFMGGLPMNLGAPQSAVQEKNGAKVLQRSFRKGDVAVNLGSRPWSFDAAQSATLYSADSRLQIAAGKRVVVGPGAAVVLLRP